MLSETGATDDAAASECVAAWAASGAMALTGPADGPPLGPPAPLVPRLRELGRSIAASAAALGTRLDVDPLTFLAERAAITGASRAGRVSCGGATRLLRCADGWVAVSLARPDDIDLVPAWLEAGGPPEDPDDVWAWVAETVCERARAELVARAAMLGLPVGALPAPAVTPSPAPCAGAFRVARDTKRTTERGGGLGELVVVDLASLWAGPLCGSLLARAGAQVVKVESTGRPDGARRGPAAFFDLLNAGRRSVALDFTAESGRTTLRRLLERADVVIEGSRPRALEQLGIHADDVLRRGRTSVWVSITGHGRGPGVRDRVGFGDDAAVEGGLVCWAGDEPSFCADAVADPVTGVAATAAVLRALVAGGAWLLDAPLAGAARHLAGPTLPVPDGVTALDPADAVPPSPTTPAPALGADTDDVLAGLGIAP